MSYITALDVSINAKDEQDLQTKGFRKIDVDLNSGVGGNKIYLWFIKGDKASAVTRVQVSFNKEMETGLQRASYTKIGRNINEGSTGGPLYMWYSRSTGDEFDVPIVDVNVTTRAESEAALLTAGYVWEEVTCNLNLGAGGDYVYAWLKRETPIYISDVTATFGYDDDYKLFSDGYTRVDVNTNMGATGGAEAFIWYRKTTDPMKSLSELSISTNPQEEKDAVADKFTVVKVNLNENTSGNAVYLWFKKATGMNYVHTMVLLTNMNAAGTYKKYNIKVIERNLNEGNRGDSIYLSNV